MLRMFTDADGLGEGVCVDEGDMNSSEDVVGV